MALLLKPGELEGINKLWEALAGQYGIRTDVKFSDLISQNLAFAEPNPTSASTIRLYVDPVSGNDNNDGSQQFPTKTLNGAFAKIPTMVKKFYTITLPAGEWNESLANLSYRVSAGGSISITGTLQDTISGTFTCSAKASDDDALVVTQPFSYTNQMLTFSPDPGWTTDQFKGKFIQRQSGPGNSNEMAVIESNTSDTIKICSQQTSMGVGTVIKIVEPGTKITGRVYLYGNQCTINLSRLTLIQNTSASSKPFPLYSYGQVDYPISVNQCRLISTQSNSAAVFTATNTNIYNSYLSLYGNYPNAISVIYNGQKTIIQNCLIDPMKYCLYVRENGFADFYATTIYNNEFLTLSCLGMGQIYLPYKIKNGAAIELAAGAFARTYDGCFIMKNDPGWAPAAGSAIRIQSGSTMWIRNTSVKLTGVQGFIVGPTGQLMIQNFSENVDVEANNCPEYAPFWANGGHISLSMEGGVSKVLAGTGNSYFGLAANGGGKITVTGQVYATGTVGDWSIDLVTGHPYSELPAQFLPDLTTITRI